jgi:hypothetical protein
MNLAVIIVSDPKGGEEALGRAFNALALASEAHAKGDNVAVVFAGAGTRWPAELAKEGHPAGPLFASVRSLIAGASAGCAAVFGATEGLAAAHVPRLTDHALPGTPGLVSLRGYAALGYQTLVF